jgi:MFS family permease
MTSALGVSSKSWLGLRLSAMFFIDIAVAGAYFPLLSLHLSKTLGLAPGQIAAVYAVGPLTALVGPPLVGWLADRVLSAERSLSAMGWLRAGMLLLASQTTSFGGMLLSMALLGLVATPAGVLSFSIAFRHLDDARGLGRTRVWGTVSWIFALFATSAYMQQFPNVSEQLAHTSSTFVFAAGLSALGALYALTLPHTPPLGVATHTFAFMAALGLLRGKSYRALVIAAALASACLQFHFMLWPLFYTDARTGLGLDVSDASRLSSIAQFLELLLFPALGLLIGRWGLRRVYLVGLLAWPLRFLAYACGQPAWFVVGMQALHGVNVVCGTVVAQIAIDRVAPRGARASAQALLVAASAGAGNLLGQILCGVALSAGTLAGGGFAWSSIFCVPLALGALASAVVWASFHPEDAPGPAGVLIEEEPPVSPAGGVR